MSLADQLKEQEKNNQGGKGKGSPISTGGRARTLGDKLSSITVGLNQDQRGLEIKTAIAKTLEDKGRKEFSVELFEKQSDIKVNSSAVVLSFTHAGETIPFVFIIDDGSFKPDIGNQSLGLAKREQKDRPFLAADLWSHSELFESELRKALAERLSINEDSIHWAGAFCIKPSLDAEEKPAINSLITEATQAIEMLLRQDTQATLVNLNGKIEVRINFSPDPTVTPNGEPVRRDWAVEIGLSTASSNNNRDIADSSYSKLLEVGGDVRLEYIEQMNMGMLPNQNIIHQIPKTHNAYIDIKTIDFVDDPDVALTLMGLALAIKALTDGGNWLNCLNNRRNELNALNYDIPIQYFPKGHDALFDALPDDFNLAEVASTIFSDVAINLVCPEAGKMSWLFDHLRAACENQQGTSADLIASAAGILLNGDGDSVKYNMSQFTVGTVLENEFTINGHFMDPENEMYRDIQEYDYLQILHLYREKGEDIIQKFGQSFDYNISPEARMHERIDVYKAIQPNFKHTGTGFLLALDPQSWEALAANIQDTLRQRLIVDYGNNLGEGRRSRGLQVTRRGFGGGIMGNQYSSHQQPTTNRQNRGGFV
tara:strand:- start:166804 stop:168591 length:1788 start_codon:yes stop_codon:yes gene_type:complete